MLAGEPETFGRYTVLSLLGQGAMGHVYLVEHKYLQQRFALKVLQPKYHRDTRLVERLLREARVEAEINHEHVIRVTDAEVLPDGSAYIVMEPLEGEDLQTTLAEEECLPWPRVRHITLQICSALAAAHAKGVVHRDLKPENCMRVRRGQDHDFIKVLDFGIAKLTGGVVGDGKLTQDFVGTPLYASPEQVNCEEIDARSDLWSLGAMMYHLLTGYPPFGGPSVARIFQAINSDEPAPMSIVAPHVKLLPEVEAVVFRALSRSREQRFQSAEEFAAAIEAIAEQTEALPGAPTTGGVAYASTVFREGPKPGSEAPENAPELPAVDAADPQPDKAPPEVAAPTSRRQLILLSVLPLLAVAAFIVERLGYGRTEALSEQSVAEQPAAGPTSLGQPEPEPPLLPDSVPAQLEAKQTEAKQPEEQKVETKKAEKTEAKKTGAKKTEAKKTEAKKTEAKPEVKKPELEGAPSETQIRARLAVPRRTAEAQCFKDHKRPPTVGIEIKVDAKGAVALSVNPPNEHQVYVGCLKQEYEKSVLAVPAGRYSDKLNKR